VQSLQHPDGELSRYKPPSFEVGQFTKTRLSPTMESPATMNSGNATSGSKGSSKKVSPLLA
jgi:hypothetical protein